MNPAGQMEINFDAGSASDGVLAWHEQRRAAQKQLADQMGLPLGHEVEVCLLDGICLRGLLRLREEMLFIEESRKPDLELAVGKVPFKASEIESCVRMD
jgi:hypothetical protein